MFNETYKLSNGVEMPLLGIGTWLLDDEQAAQAVRDAVSNGYRHIDTAQAYMNEAGIGEGIRSSGVEREELFITTKVAAEAKTYEEVTESIDESLTKMGLDYIDLLIIHSPQPWTEFREENRYFEENKEAWKAMEDAYKAGKVKAIGLSNFLQDDIENILSSCEIKPMVNQVLVHVSNTPLDLIEFCQKNDILVEAYSPIAHGAVLDNKEVKVIADKYGVSVAQLCLRYDIQLGLAVIPKTANPDHMRINAELDFVISDADMEILKNVEPIQDYGEHSYFPVFGGKLK
ncbi:aldo/keto reductase [Priestia megaterium]|jgi:diketogulonate reductase-like aldo/keto reductase|uniref:aldo/keto reductase n=1 Tax=Priestia megaterium TaxID=1404 RepID=UPI00215A6E6D|nr:aldo/keto reductase [Priestia megaterium]MCR8862450.1 aldo/keto reductase [Priestia megaterium]MDR7202074.1 diketogulonate reductase-like aldo/keto reductase [Priestia megaterium]MED3859925.1 aldo/keto reductase [Priestia megaterium]MED3900712.1 aldo/keto reductase [Priestia megaterium]MED3966593.1 aldo/keto reductase [Priestia megaterium]